nr:HAMP domain-containing histidine kinase [Actinomycetota bacterium]
AQNTEAALSGGMPGVLTGFADEDTVAQVVSSDGHVLASTANLAGRGPMAPLPTKAGPTVRTVHDLPHDPAVFRMLSHKVDSPQGPVLVLVAAPIGDVNASVNTLARSLVLAVPVVAALLGVLVWVLVGRTLHPVETIRAEVTRIDGSDLHRRVPEPGTGDEIDRLAHTMNSMLDRTEEAAKRQQQFVADASHELRSPLTRIRTELEVDLARAGEADLMATHRSVLDETIGLQQLIEDLLHLARSDAGTAPKTHQPVDLDDIVLSCAAGLRAQGQVSVDTTGVGAARVAGDAQQLHRAVTNLVDNAARHGKERVTLSLVEHENIVVMSVSDDGPGIPASASELVFARFVRLDDARAASSGGTGLGLAITRDIVERHGGTIRIDPDYHDGARVVVSLPSPERPPEL